MHSYDIFTCIYLSNMSFEGWFPFGDFHYMNCDLGTIGRINLIG